MANKFEEVATYVGRGAKSNEEVQVGTYDGQEYVLYYYKYGVVVDRTYHSNVKSALQTASDYIWSAHEQVLDSTPRN